MTKKWLVAIIALVLMVSAVSVFAAPKLKVVLYLNGTLGDKSFFDSANRGVLQAGKELGVTTKVIEGGYDSSRWEPDLAQLSEGRLGRHHCRHLAAPGGPGEAGAQVPQDEVHHLRYLGDLLQGRAGQRLLHPLQAE